MSNREKVIQELATLADQVLNGEITESEEREIETLTVDNSLRAAYFATEQTDVYETDPASVLDYTKNVPEAWEHYVSDELGEVEAMAKASFEQELYKYLETYIEEGDSN